MDKIIHTNCQCGCNPTLPENLLKITSGNDFSIKLQLTEKIDDNWVHYDMTDMSNVIVSVMSPNNTATELDYIIDVAGNIQAIVDAQKFQSYIIYGVEVLWTDATDVVSVDKRAYAPNVFAFVNSSMEATDSSYEYTSDSPYEYNISMSNDVVCLSIGYVPDVDLSDYYTKEEIDSTLENYATDQDVADAISTIDLSNYVTNSSLTTTLQDYETKSELSTTLQDYAQLSDLSDYVTTTSLNNTLNDYVTDSELTTALNPYATQQYVDNAVAHIDTTNFYTKSDIDTTLTSYGTSLSSPGWLITGGEPNYMLSYQIKLEHNGTELNRVRIPAHTKSKNADDQWYSPFYSALLKNNDYLAFLNGLDTLSEISSDYVTNSSLTTTLEDYALYDDIDNYNNTISTALIEHQRSIIDINSNFDNYYNKTASDSRYVTASQVANQYVNNSSLDNVTQTTAASLNDLNDRVTTLEQGGGGGGGGGTIPSNVVTSDDGNEIVCLTQSEYDTLKQNGQLDSDVFYYITDATSNYVTNSDLTDAINNLNIPTATSELNNDSGFVSSSSITTILQISQSDYDTLVNNSQVDANTLYIIV